MKKSSLAIAALAMALSLPALAVDVGLSVGRTSAEQDVSRVSISQAVEQYNVEASLSRVRDGRFSSDVAALTLGTPVLNLGKAHVDVYGGAAYAYTQTQRGYGVVVSPARSRSLDESGFAVVYGIKGIYPVAKNVDLVVDARSFNGQGRIQTAQTNSVTAGVNIKF